MLEIEWAGRLEYESAWQYQKSLVEAREENPHLNDRLLLLEHPPTYTLGRHGNIDNLLLDRQTLDERGFSVHRVVLDDFAIEGQRFEGHRGVWLETAAGMKKIAAIGIHVTASGISSHGFALNVDPDLDHFSGIVPCGIHDYGVTSMTAALNKPLTLAEVIPRVIQAFTEVLTLEIVPEGVHYAYD